MAFCTKCGSENPETDAFCGKCGAPRAGATVEAQPAESGPPPADRVAQIALKKEHNKLVVGLGMLGAVVSFICLVVLFTIAAAMPRQVAGGFLSLVSLAAAAFFLALFFPAFANSFNQRIASKRTIDPATGRPLRVVWWFRWLAAMIALTTFGGAGDYFSPPAADRLAAPATASAPADATPEYELAVIDAGAQIPADDSRVSRFRDLLEQLSETYSGSEQAIADQTVKAQELLKKKGIDESLLNIMSGMSQIFATRDRNQKYADVLAMYAVLREQGESHAAAAEGVHEAVNALERMAAGKANVSNPVPAGATDIETPPPAAATQPLVSYCSVIEEEDEDNGGIRADGKPWDLTDLAIEGTTYYNINSLNGRSDLPHAGRILYDALRREPAHETIRRMCRGLGQRVSSPNGSINLTVADAAHALEQTIRLSPPP